MDDRPLRKILYIDDLSFHLTSVKSRLKNKYEIYPTQDLETMYEILANVDIELILLDVNMPEVNGFKILEGLKQDIRYCNIPVIFLTSQKNKKSVLKGMSLGAVDFMTKPFMDSELVSAIEYVFEPEKQYNIRPIILAIDDDASILQAVNVLLEDKYTVYTMPGVGGEDMIKELFKKISPDLFILDCNMPVLSGFEIAEIIRNNPEYEETPIMFLTAEGTKDAIFIALRFDACEFLVKPLDKDILLDKVEKHLENYIIRRRMRTIADDKRR